MTNLASSEGMQVDKTKLSEYAFFTAFFIYIVQSYISWSMLNYLIPHSLVTSLLTISIGIMVIKILFLTDYSFLDVIILLSWVAVMLAVYFNMRELNILVVSLLIFSCKDIAFQRLIKFFFIVNVVLLIGTFLLVQAGVIQDLIYTRESGNRHALGSLYPTNISARFYFLSVCYLYLKRKKLKMLDVAAILVIALIILNLTDGRLDCYLMMVTPLILLGVQKIRANKLKIAGAIAMFSTLIGTSISYYTAVHYDSFSNFYAFINKLFSGRLAIGQQALTLYPIRWLGQFIYQNGNGGLEGQNNIVNSYFFIDSSFLDLLLRYGLMFFIMLNAVVIYKLFKQYQTGNYLFMILFAFTCINSIVATFLFMPTFNPFILFIFAQIPSETSRNVAKEPSTRVQATSWKEEQLIQ